MEFSFLFKNEYEIKTKEPEFFNNLKLDQIRDSIYQKEEDFYLKDYFYTPLKSEDDIKYRQDVFKDLISKDYYSEFRNYFGRLYSIYKAFEANKKSSLTWVNRHKKIKILGEYINTINKLNEFLNSIEFKSEAINNFKNYLNDFIKGDNFVKLSTYNNDIKATFKKIKFSYLIQNSNIYVTPYEGDKEYASFVNETSEIFTYNKDLKIPTIENYVHTDSVDDEIYKALVILFPKEFKLIKEFFDEIKDFYDESLKKIVLDIRFYFIYISYMNFLKSDDIYFSIPELSKDFNEESIDSFDLALYYKLFKEHNKIVTNSYQITNDERMIIITGPNQGGKTTFTRQIGQLHYLASLGLLIPGLKNKIHIVDNIYTFFKTEENLDNLDGKLKIELESVKKILSEASKNSLILFNEIFASTTKLDGLKIANLIMNEINNLGSMCVFVTFLTDLKNRKDVILMCSNVNKENSAIRTFKITRTDNFDSAYPSSIQNKYGLTYQEIKERLK